MRPQAASVARRCAAVLAAVGAVALAGCGSGDDAGAVRTTPAATDPRFLVVALGDSLSRGVQRDASVSLKRGYAQVLTARLRAQHPEGVALVEAACGGATTSSMIRGGQACAPPAPIPYPNQDAAGSQLDWAVHFLRARGDRPTLVTMTMGGNDVVSCMTQDAQSVSGCIATGRPAFAKQLRRITKLIGRAAGRRTVLVGSTLYDPFLGALRTGRFPAAAVRAVHTAIVGEVNPLIRRTLEKTGWRLADLGAAADETGAIDGPDSTPVQTICASTWACTGAGDVHLNDAGYEAAARLFATAAASG